MARKKSHKSAKLTAMDLFCGAGGLSLGLAQAGIKPVFAVDHMPLAVEHYNANVGDHAVVSDIAKTASKIIKHGRKLKPDVICGGPPCQDFSIAGKRVEGKRARLTIVFARIVTAIKPRWVIMENVPRAILSVTYKKALRILTNAGYDIDVAIWDASRHNVPQNRRRLILVGRLESLPRSVTTVRHMSSWRKPLTVREYFRTIGEPLDTDHYFCRPYRGNRSVFSIDEPAPTMIGRNRNVSKGILEHPKNPVSPWKTRSLTERERSLIQTFPKEYKWHGPKTHINTLIGNAVPVNLAKSIGMAVTAERRSLFEAF